jgi:thiamine-monophosphate kinase
MISKLRDAGIRPTAMMDISDGLSSELHHICKQSHCGCRIYEKEILNGGEDYELLFTVPIGDHEKVSAMEGVRQIGYITKEELGLKLVTRDNNEFDLPAQGWNPLKQQ